MNQTIEKRKTDLEIFQESSQGWDTISFKEMTIEYLIERKGQFFFIEPNELFCQGIAFDGYSQSAFLAIYKAINEKNKKKLRDEILTKDPYKFASILDSMWEWVK